MDADSHLCHFQQGSMLRTKSFQEKHEHFLKQDSSFYDPEPAISNC